MNTAHLLVSSYDPFFPRSGNDNKWAHTARTRVPQGTSEHSQALEGCALSRNGSPWRGITRPGRGTSHPHPPSKLTPGLLAGRSRGSLERPRPLSRLRTRVRNGATHSFLRRACLHVCQGPQSAGWFPRPGRCPGMHRPQPHGCPLPAAFGPAQHAVGTRLSEEAAGGRPGAPGRGGGRRKPIFPLKLPLAVQQTTHWNNFFLLFFFKSCLFQFCILSSGQMSDNISLQISPHVFWRTSAEVRQEHLR